MDFPMQFLVDVEGEEFNVTVRGLGGTDADESSAADAGGTAAKRGSADAPGAVKPNMAGSLVSIKVSPEQTINEGDPLATLEAMKMLREVNSPHGGVVKEIFFEEGDMLDADDVLMIVEPTNE